MDDCDESSAAPIKQAELPSGNGLLTVSGGRGERIRSPHHGPSERDRLVVPKKGKKCDDAAPGCVEDSATGIALPVGWWSSVSQDALKSCSPDLGYSDKSERCSGGKPNSIPAALA
jgi:hypothetical protein